jgi:hypothetical protein
MREISEFPEGEAGGSGSVPHRPGGIGGPNELSPFVRQRYSQLIRVVFQMRNRLHALENTVTAMRLGGGAQLYLPNEISEGEGEGGGGGEIREIVHPPEIHEIAEAPIINQVVQQVSSLATRFAVFEQSVLKQLQVITQRLDSMKG